MQLKGLRMFTKSGRRIFWMHDDFVKDILEGRYAQEEAPESKELSRNQENNEYGQEMNFHDSAHDFGIQNIGLNQVNADDEQHQFQNEGETSCLESEDAYGQTWYK